MNLKKMMSKKNLDLLAKLFIFFIILWIIMFIIPSLFIFLFDSYLGNLILFGLIILFGIYNLRFSIGFAIIIIILYRFNYLSRYQLLH
jgi:hypothetical protein